MRPRDWLLLLIGLVERRDADGYRWRRVGLTDSYARYPASVARSVFRR
jgi:hypothetical protein